jgi:hypothetical protein
MSATTASHGSPTTRPFPGVDKPRYKLSELTTYELRDYRRELEKGIAFFDAQRPVPPARDVLQARLEAVIGEQDDRVRIARA